MSAATLDFEDVRVLEEKETFELINVNEASTAPQQPPKMLTAPGLMTTGNSNVVEMKFKVGNTKPGASNKNNGKLLLNFESSKRRRTRRRRSSRTDENLPTVPEVLIWEELPRKFVIN